MSKINWQWRHHRDIWWEAPASFTIGVAHFKSKKNHVRVCISRCNKKDQFCKKTGREQAITNGVQVLHIRQAVVLYAQYLVVYQAYSKNHAYEIASTHLMRFVE